MYIQPESERNAPVLWSGNTYNFRKVLDEAGVRGAYQDNDEDGTRTYYRCLRDIDITSEPDKVEDIIKDAYKNLAMKVVVESDPVKDSDDDSWIDCLSTLNCLHFEN